MGFIGSTFRPFFAIPQVPSATRLSGQTTPITSANSGIGHEAARQLVRLGVETIILPFARC